MQGIFGVTWNEATTVGYVYNIPAYMYPLTLVRRISFEGKTIVAVLQNAVEQYVSTLLFEGLGESTHYPADIKNVSS